MEDCKSISECPAVDELVEFSKTLANGESSLEVYQLKWIPYRKFTDIESTGHSTGNQPTYYAMYEQAKTDDKQVEMLLLGTVDECTHEFIHEFARTHSLPTHKYNSQPNMNQFRRYSVWLERRNDMIEGFTSDNNNYYLVADRHFHRCYSRYGFCSACGILRCSPVWCICGHKEISQRWTSNNKRLDEFITKSQRQTKSPNEAYLEWIPFDHLSHRRDDVYELYANQCRVSLRPLEITDKTDD